MDLREVLLLGCIVTLSFTLAFYGSAVGLILGHLRLPLLALYLPTAASGVATNLAISGLGALTGTLRHFRAGRVSWPLLVVMGLPSVAGGLLGGLLLARLASGWVTLFLGAFLVYSGLGLLRPDREAPALNLGRHARLGLEVLVGLALGFLASCTGLMLGSMRLPMMIRWLGIDPQKAVGTNMAIGCLTAGAGAASLWAQGGTFHLVPVLVVAPPTILGGYLGARWTGRFRKESLQALVGWTVAVTGLLMACQGLLQLV